MDREKRVYEQFVREISEVVDTEKKWEWKRSSDLKVETEATLLDYYTGNFVEPS